MITLTYNQKLNAAIATFPYDPDLVLLAKSIGARADYEEGKFKLWKIELTEEFAANLDALEKDNRFDVDPTIRAALETVQDWHSENLWLSNAEALNFKMKITPVIDESIKDYQRAGVWYISRNARGVLVGDEMGLGKTLTSLAAVEYMKDSPVLIVCPAVVKYNWRNELMKWLPNRSHYVFAGRLDHFREDLNYYIINYDLLEKYWKEINSIKFKGRLSSAEGSRNPCSTKVLFRARSPRYIPPICGTVTWLSSMMINQSFGKYSSKVGGAAPGGLPVKCRE